MTLRLLSWQSGWMGDGWKGHGFALVAGSMMTLALEPFQWWPFALISIAIFYLGLVNASVREAAWRGWWYGLGTFLAGTHWIYVSIHDFGGATPWLAGFLLVALCMGLALFFALPAALWAGLFRIQGFAFGNALGFAAWWFFQEWLRGWFLTGFPWLYAGYSQLYQPLSGWASIGGVGLISALLVFTTIVCVMFFQTSLQALKTSVFKHVLVVISVVALWVGGMTLLDIRWSEHEGDSLSVVLVQGNVPLNLKWESEQAMAQIELYRDLTNSVPPAQLVLWPETAIPLIYDQLEYDPAASSESKANLVEKHAPSDIQTIDLLGHLSRWAHERDTALITGIPLVETNLVDNEKHYFNGVLALGQGQGIYRKQRLVPFGEYVPLESWLRGLITFFDLPMSNFERGQSNQPLLSVGDNDFPVLICYEIVYPDFVASMAKQARFLTTISNDAWFGNSIGPIQHFQMAKMRALETQKWLIRATNNGITAIVKPDGKVASELTSNIQGVLQGNIQPMLGNTPYVIFGSLPWLILAWLLLIINAVRRYRSKKSSSSRS